MDAKDSYGHTSEEVAAIINRLVPGARINLPMDQDDGALRALVGDWPAVPLENGIRHTISAFRDLVNRGLVVS